MLTKTDEGTLELCEHRVVVRIGYVCKICHCEAVEAGNSALSALKAKHAEFVRRVRAGTVAILNSCERDSRSEFIAEKICTLCDAEVE